LTIVCVGAAFISLLLIPAIKLQKAMMYMIAAVFWISVILEQVFFWKCNSDRKQMERKTWPKRRQKNAPIGIAAFFKNPEAIVADAVLFISAISTTLIAAFRVQISWLIIMSISLLFLSFNMHCILNGRNYRCMKSYEKYKKTKKPANKKSREISKM
jgi:hypothetical protein